MNILKWASQSHGVNNPNMAPHWQSLKEQCQNIPTSRYKAAVITVMRLEAVIIATAIQLSTD